MALEVSGNKAKIIHLTDEQVVKRLNHYMDVGLRRLKVLKDEWDAVNASYQCALLQRGNVGGLDARLAEAIAKQTGDLEQASFICPRLASAINNFHSKLVVSEPTVVAISLDRTFDGKMREKYVQQYCDNIYYSYRIKEILDTECWVDLALKGFCAMYVGWDKNAGDIQHVSKGEDQLSFIMSGDHVFRRQDPLLFIIDIQASRFYDAEWCIAGQRVPVDTLRVTFPDKEEEIVRATEDSEMVAEGRGDLGSEVNKGEAILWTYYEKHLLRNNYRGAVVKFLYINKEIILLSREELDNEHGELPFVVMTDLDIPGNPYGMSRAALCVGLNDRLSKFIAMIESHIDTYGRARVLVASQNNSGIENRNGVTFISYNALLGERPTYLQPSNITTDIWRFYELLTREMDIIYSSGEFDRGEINRELSSYAVLTAIERSEAKLANIFNKKTWFIKRMYTLALSDARQYIKNEREFRLNGLNSEHMFASFKGADLQGRINLSINFGLYMPVDPAARKAQIYDIIKNNLAQRAGINEKEVISQLLGGDLRKVKEMMDMAKEVQEEEIMRIISGQEAPVQPYHEHLSHIAVLAEYMNGTEFEKLPAEIKQAIFDHYAQHTAEVAKLQAGAMQQGGLPT